MQGREKIEIRRKKKGKTRENPKIKEGATAKKKKIKTTKKPDESHRGYESFNLRRDL